jgi:hypothetical protein
VSFCLRHCFGWSEHAVLVNCHAHVMLQAPRLSFPFSHHLYRASASYTPRCSYKMDFLEEVAHIPVQWQITIAAMVFYTVVVEEHTSEGDSDVNVPSAVSS